MGTAGGVAGAIGGMVFGFSFRPLDAACTYDSNEMISSMDED
jgi:hypothetical protein